MYLDRPKAESEGFFMFIKPGDLSPNDVNALRIKLNRNLRQKASSELNFYFDHNNKIACFLNSEHPYTGYFLVTDASFMPVIIFSTTAYINACSISDSGRYAICQTAHNPAHDEDDGVFILMDLRYRVVINRLRLSSGWIGMTGLVLKETERTFRVYYGNYWTEYDFNGRKLQESIIELPKESRKDVTAYLKTSLSPYQLNEDAFALINSLASHYDKEIEEKAVVLLNAAELHPSMSKYQLSLTHKAVGDVDYTNAFYGSALAHYTAALKYNGKLGIKRRIKELTSMAEKERKFVCSPDIVENVLVFQEYAKFAAEVKPQRTPRQRISKPANDFSINPQIMDRVNALDNESRDAFYQTMEKRQATRRDDDVLSLSDYASLTLDALERSARMRNSGG